MDLQSSFEGAETGPGGGRRRRRGGDGGSGGSSDGDGDGNMEVQLDSLMQGLKVRAGAAGSRGCPGAGMAPAPLGILSFWRYMC
jgi:hypothetical protein